MLRNSIHHSKVSLDIFTTPTELDPSTRFVFSKISHTDIDIEPLTEYKKDLSPNTSGQSSFGHLECSTPTKSTPRFRKQMRIFL